MPSAGGSDQSVRERALSAAESFIVQAPAGSGKTELLIQRYLRLLGRVREPEEIVAITFTRKAAAEMRERIVDALSHSGADPGSDDAVVARRLELARRAMDNDRHRGWDLVQHPARLQIQTIDALCLALTRQLPFLSGFAAPSGIVDDAYAAYRRAAVETVKLLGGPDRRWRVAIERFLTHVDNDMARATDLLADMLASRDQWLRHVGVGVANPEDVTVAWRHVAAAELKRARASLPAALITPLTECTAAAAAHFVREGGTNGPAARAWLEAAEFPAPRAEELPRWRFLADLLIKQDGDWRRQVNKTQGFPPESEAKAVSRPAVRPKAATRMPTAMAGLR